MKKKDSVSAEAVIQITGPECCTPKCALPLGRPRAFDVEEALERALGVFWRKGYEGASLSDLTDAMGINRPSLYAAFGNKESLFRKVVERYSARAGTYLCAALAQPTARGAVERLLRERIESLTAQDTPVTCLLMQSALSCEVLPDSLHREVLGHAAAAQDALRVRLERGRGEGELPSSTDCAALARYFMAVMQGMTAQAAGGANHAELEAVAATALRAWPA